MRYYTYIYFDEQLRPYYVGCGMRRRYLDRHRVPVPPPERILRFDQDCQQAAYAFETYLIKRIGRRDLGTGPLLNLTDGGPGAKNLCATTRKAISQACLGNTWSSGLLWSPERKAAHAERVSKLRAERFWSSGRKKKVA